MRIVCMLIAGFLQVALAAAPAAAGLLFNPLATQVPDTVGDQLVFYYDARDGFTTFLNIRNNDDSFDLCNVHLIFYSGGFSLPFVMDFGPLMHGSLRTIDIGAVRDAGLAKMPGVAIAYATSLGTGSDCDLNTPIVTRMLTGNFTVANLATGSAWGSPAPARSAVTPTMMNPASGVGSPSGIGEGFTTPPRGTPIDGSTVLLQPIQPGTVDLASYYDPNSLAPVSQSGNQLIFVSFADLSGSAYSAIPATTTWHVTATRKDGTPIAETTFGASGVTVTDLASVAGAGVNGASGSIRFDAQFSANPVTQLAFFAEALGTFGTGYLLPMRRQLVDPPE